MKDQVNTSSDEISVKEIIEGIKNWWAYLKSKWQLIFFACIFGGLIGFGYAWFKPLTYTAKMTFTVEDGKNSSSGLGGLASLAGQFGVDVGNSNGGSVLSSDNILLYLKSQNLAREVLLSPYQEGAIKSVADIYVDMYSLKKKWSKDRGISNVEFRPYSSGITYTRIQEGLLQEIIAQINKSEFSVGRTDKKTSFIDVTVTMENEELAKLYCEKIVKIAIDRYVVLKTNRQKLSVDKIQTRLDSVTSLLNQKTAYSATLQSFSSTTDINPLFKTNTSIATEKTLRDKALLSNIFVSLSQNLEVAKFSLNQNTPVIQIIDQPILPLVLNRTSKAKSSITIALLFGLAMTTFLVIRRSLVGF